MAQKKSRVLGGVLFIAGTLLFFLSPGTDTPPVAEEDAMRFTFTWDSLGLPHLPDSRITRIGSSNEGESDYEIDLDTQHSTEEVRQFFEEELADRDFRSGQAQSNNEDRYQNEFSSRDFDVSVDAKPDPNDPGASKVRIVIRRDPEIQTRAYQSATRID